MKQCTISKLNRLCKTNEIICYGYTEWFKLICKNKNILSKIVFLLDDNPNLWGKSVECQGKKFFVRNPMEIKKDLNRNTIIVITASYQEKLYRKLTDIFRGKKLRIYSCPCPSDKLAVRFRWIFSMVTPKNIIVFRSGLGKYSAPWEYADNSRALFEYMIEKGLNQQYRLVWAVKYPEMFQDLKRNKNVDVISYDWETTNNVFKALKYEYYIYCSKIFFFTETCHWLRYIGKKQIAVNLWHGCGIKGRKAKTEPTGSHYNYMVVNSELYAKIHAEQYGCKMEQMLVTGLPKQDWLFKKLPKSIEEILNIDKRRKNVFWLPTFRKTQCGFENLNENTLNSETGLPVLRTFFQLKTLNDFLIDHNMNLIIKLHPLQEESVLSMKKYTNIFFLDNATMQQLSYPINMLLSQADAMISDYSSAAIDYMLLDRPIGFTLDDLTEYEHSRGLNFENIHDFLPGKEIYIYNEFIEFLDEVDKGEDPSSEKRKRLLKIMHTYYDGENCKRIIKYFDL